MSLSTYLFLSHHIYVGASVSISFSLSPPLYMTVSASLCVYLSYTPDVLSSQRYYYCVHYMCHQKPTSNTNETYTNDTRDLLTLHTKIFNHNKTDQHMRQKRPGDSTHCKTDQNYRSLLQNIICFIGLFCKKDL